MNLKYIDIHSHLNFPKFKEDLSEVLARMESVGVGTISVGVDKKTSEEVVKLANQHENLWACIGIHPDSASSEDDSDRDSKGEFDQEFFEELVKNPKVVCVGECGLDYFSAEGGSASGWRISSDEKLRQKKLFEQQIDFAVPHDLPLMLHVRPSKDTQDAHLDVFKILESYKRKYGDKLRGNSHFFSSTEEIAKKYISLGFTISLTGLITYIKDFDETIKNTPLEMMHIETDSPFVLPVPYRGNPPGRQPGRTGRNEPTYVVEVAKRMAEIKGIPEAELSQKILENSSKFFNLGLK